MRSQALAVYKIFEKTYGEAEARTIVQFVEDVDTTVLGKVIDSKVAHLATKEELREVRDEMREEFKEVRIEMKEGFQQLRSEMKEGFQQFRSEMKDVYATKEDLSNVKSDLTQLIFETRSELTRSINKTKSDLTQLIFETKSELIELIKSSKKSAAVSSMVQIITIIVSLFVIAKYILK